MNMNNIQSPMGYNSYYPNPYLSQRYNTPSNGIVWVQGIEGAKAYQLPNNSNAILLDSESDKFYIKTSDNIGMCNLRTFQFTEITSTQPAPATTHTEIDMSQYVTKTELNNILGNLNTKGGKSNGKQLIPTTDGSAKPVISE
jgi:hypothetical protein